ncbi:MAG: ankyrin repeat domain-containing protein [Candidatus Omnitrophica bacterium]|nr:ankyrin repeat domain-containing protein [Candidatus Omnitrophota bacterium]
MRIKKITITIYILIVGHLSLAQPAQTNDDPYLADYQDKVTFEKRMAKLLFHEKFEELNRIIKEIETFDEKFASGTPKVDHFYLGLKSTYHEKRKIYYTVYDKKLRNWHQLYPRSDAALVALADIYADYARNIRKNFTADTTTKKKNTDIKKFLKKSLNYIKMSLDLNPESEHAYALHLRIARDFEYREKELKKIFQQGLLADEFYFPLYAQMTDALIHLDKGTEELSLKFINQTYESLPEDVRDEYYARMANVVRRFYPHHHVKKYPFSWDIIKDGYEQRLKKYPYNFYDLNAFTLFACIFEDRPTARYLFKLINDRWDLYSEQIWINGYYFQIKKEWALTETIKVKRKKSIHDIIKEGNVFEFKNLLKDNPNLNMLDSEGNTPFIIALKNKDRIIANMLLDQDIDLSIPDNDGHAAIHHAAWLGLDLLFVKILEDGEDINAAGLNIYQWRPIHCAASNGHTKIIEIILGQPHSKINAQINSGATALHYAANGGFNDIVEILLMRDDIEIDLQDQYGYTPLHNAVLKGYTKIVRLLIRAGADVTRKNNNGFTPTDLAKITSPDILNVLEEAITNENNIKSIK